MLTVALVGDQVGLDNKTVDVSDAAQVLQGLVAGTSQPGAGVPVAGNGAVALDLEEEVDGEIVADFDAAIVAYSALREGRAQAQDIEAPHGVVAVAAGSLATDRGDDALEALDHGDGLAVEQGNHRVARRDGGEGAGRRPGATLRAVLSLAGQLVEDAWVRGATDLAVGGAGHVGKSCLFVWRSVAVIVVSHCVCK